jgi:hypothetical protein
MTEAEISELITVIGGLITAGLWFWIVCMLVKAIMMKQ